jgi:carbon monoxide dehydrogenase subunit G
MRLENSFVVAAPPAEVWALLNDVPRVVPCMPGAELTETVDENAWKGLVHVRLGPISLEFGTDVVRESADESARRVVLVTDARELRNRGSAHATIDSVLSEEDAATRVEIVTEVELKGTVAQFGRGVVPDVAAQLTRQFAANLAQLIESEKTAAAPAAVTGEPADAPAPPAEGPAPRAEVRPVSGLRLGLRAVWSSLARLFRR